MALIFSANSGRCGSRFLSAAIGHLTGIPSFHEPCPWLINEVCRDINNAEVKFSENTKRVLYEKIRFIIENARDGWYCETSQMFIKCLVDTVLLNFKDVYVIYLERNLDEVLLSYYRKCWRREIDWFLQPQWKANFLRKKGNFSFMDIVEFNWHEVKARYEAYKHRFTKTWEFDFKDMNNLDEYYRMFDHFGMEYRKIKRFPPLIKEYKNVLAEAEKAGGREKAMIEDMRNNWDLPPMKRWRFPLDIIQINSKQG